MYCIVKVLDYLQLIKNFRTTKLLLIKLQVFRNRVPDIYHTFNNEISHDFVADNDSDNDLRRCRYS